MVKFGKGFYEVSIFDLILLFSVGLLITPMNGEVQIVKAIALLYTFFYFLGFIMFYSLFFIKNIFGNGMEGILALVFLLNALFLVISVLIFLPMTTGFIWKGLFNLNERHYIFIPAGLVFILSLFWRDRIKKMQNLVVSEQQ